MSFLIAGLLCCLAATLAASAGTFWLCRSHYQRKASVHHNAEARRAAEVLMRLQALAARVALDVDDHSSQIEEINDKLTSADKHDPTTIVDVVAKLIEANEHMHKKLASSEGRLREQAQVIQTHLAEARTDALTLLANRRAFEDELARRATEFARHGRTFSLIMADVDRFKRFNDAYGHQTGDEVLLGVAKLLRRKMREMDLVARYGGEEFTVILPGANLDEACKAALRACEAVEKSRFHHDGKELQVTASFGVAEVSGSVDGAALVGRVDRALYAAKNGGRNCVYLDDGKDVRRVLAKQPSVPAVAAVQPPPPPLPIEQVEAEEPGPALDVGTVESEPDLPRNVDLGPVPNLPSRFMFCQQVRNRTAEWKRGGPTFSVVLLEVNQYDENGGEHGQRVRELATRATIRYLAAMVREMDVVGHYSPGCFALMLPSAGLSEAIRVAERLREGLTQHSLVADDERPRLTLSVGVVHVMARDDSISVLQRAEAALDAADRVGGNSVYYHDGERCVPITAMLKTMGYLT